jgi:hypothetical protein
VSASRSIVGAHLTAGGEPAAAARGEAEALREKAWTFSESVLAGPGTDPPRPFEEPSLAALQRVSIVLELSASLCVVDAEAPLAFQAHPIGGCEPR